MPLTSLVRMDAVPDTAAESLTHVLSDKAIYSYTAPRVLTSLGLTHFSRAAERGVQEEEEV